MTLLFEDRGGLARELHLISDEGLPTKRGVADVMRAALLRWRVAPRRMVLRFARQQIEAAGLQDLYPAADVAEILDKLVELSDCQEVSIGRERYVAITMPRWIRTGRDSAVILGGVDLPDEGSVTLPHSANDIVRRLSPFSEELEMALHLAGVECSDLNQWLRPARHLVYAARRLKMPIGDDSMSLKSYWDMLNVQLGVEGLPMKDDGELRILSGRPGGFFGNYSAPVPEGRWSIVPVDGIWCAYRRGYNETHWHPALVEIEGAERRCLDLYDADEWRWAMLARTRACGGEEVVTRANNCVKFTFPPPTQLLTTMDILGERDGPWSWTVSEGSPDVWSMIC